MKPEEQRARDAAKEFRDRHGLAFAPVGDLQKLVESLDIDMIVRPLPDGVDAFTLKDPATGKTLLAVAATSNAERQRFTIAHELGHVEFEDFVEGSAPHSFDHPNEDEAHTFARHLLIPIEGMEEQLGEMGAVRGGLSLEDLSGLVQTFGVSPHVATIQLQDNGWAGSEADSWKGLSGASLAARFGWESERAALVKASEVTRPSQRLVTKVLKAFQSGLVSESVVAGVADLKASEVEGYLARAGIEVQHHDDEEEVERPEIEIDDF